MVKFVKTVQHMTTSRLSSNLRLQQSVSIHPTCGATQPNSPLCPQRMEPNHWRCAPTCQHGRGCQHRWTALWIHQWQMRRHFRRPGSSDPRWHPSHATSPEWLQSPAAFSWAHQQLDESFQPRWKRKGSKWQSELVLPQAAEPPEEEEVLAEAPADHPSTAMHRRGHRGCTSRQSGGGSPKWDCCLVSRGTTEISKTCDWSIDVNWLYHAKPIMVNVNNQTCVQTVCISSNILWQIRQFSTLIHISIVALLDKLFLHLFTCFSFAKKLSVSLKHATGSCCWPHHALCASWKFGFPAQLGRSLRLPVSDNMNASYFQAAVKRHRFMILYIYIYDFTSRRSGICIFHTLTILMMQMDCKERSLRVVRWLEFPTNLKQGEDGLSIC